MPERLILESRSVEETCRIGHKLGAGLTGGLTVALNGQLGSGKTHFVRSVCDGLGVDEDQVNSPTFVLMQIYSDGRLPVFHFDTYRIGDTDEFLAIGAEDRLYDEDAECLIEWAEKVSEVLPEDHLQITMEQLTETGRRLDVCSFGPRSDAALALLKDASISNDG